MAQKQMNLLPPARRWSLRQEVTLNAVTRFARAVAVGLLSLALLAAAVSVGLWGFANLTSNRTAESELGRQVAAYDRKKSEVKRYNSLLEVIDSLGRERLVWSDIIPDLLDIVPSGIIIGRLEADRESNTIYFSGSSVARSSLVVFEERLGELPWVKDVKAPRANLLNPVNAPYEFTLTLKEDYVDQ